MSPGQMAWRSPVSTVDIRLPSGDNAGQDGRIIDSALGEGAGKGFGLGRMLEKPYPGIRMRYTSLCMGHHICHEGDHEGLRRDVANDDVAFDLCPGEIHALLGENGAGKTTLMSILFGMVRSRRGRDRARRRGRSTSPAPQDALERGIGMVHQHFMLVPGLHRRRERRARHRVRLRPEAAPEGHRAAGSAEAAERLQHRHRRRPARIRDLPIDTQQRVEILKLLYRGANVLILDEPTSSLGPAQIEDLFTSLSSLREDGCSIVIVTHKLNEVMEIADRVTVLQARAATSPTEQRGSSTSAPWRG